MKRGLVFISCLMIISACLSAQQSQDLKSCLQLALDNNHNLKKSRFDLEKSAMARREVIGALLPQVNGTGNLNNNIQKSQFIMPNFINEFLPENMQDPNASKYMTIEMGTNFSAGVGATLNQQLLNFPLFNAIDIASAVESLSALSVEAREEDVIAQTASLYYAIQTTNYAADLFNRSTAIMDSMIFTMEGNYASGLVRKVDLDRLKVMRTNLLTQQAAVKNAAEVQKNLIRIQMGLNMEDPLEIAAIDLNELESFHGLENTMSFDPGIQTAFRIVEKQKAITLLQKRAATYESLPVLTAMINYNFNGVSDEFFRGETNYWYGSSMAGLSLRIPVFGGLSRSAKIKEADLEIQKINEDAYSLEASLDMVFKNALMKLNDNHRTIQLQHENMLLAEEVYRISASNFSSGLATISDVLNASSSLVQSQMSYADALNNYMKAWIELKKAGGTIKELAE